MDLDGRYKMAEAGFATTRRYKKLTCIGIVLLLGVGVAAAQSKPDSLKSGFENPPESARPRVWWHWMNGNISETGIKLDLEWMHRIGLGGFTTFDAALATPQVVEKRLAYMTPEWKEAFRYATTLGDQLGLEESIASSPGWSETGGPWVTGPEAMKKYVWSETSVIGGEPFRGKLAHPPTVTGPFQDIVGSTGSQFYADSAVVAYRRPADDVAIKSLHPQITWSGGNIDVAKLTDGDLMTATSLSKMPEVGQKA